VHQTINTTIKPDENTKIGNGFDVAFDQITFGVMGTEFIPWIETLPSKP
jgi:hypothetical protein